jgi:tetratricopeptide (TPR) repeat protein
MIPAPAPTRLLAASIAVALALAPLGATASPLRIVAPPPATEAASAPTSAPTATTEESAAAATSPTQPLSDDPAIEYRRGEQAYALGNYEQAVRHFERSYQLSNFAELLYNLGKAYAQWYDLNHDLGLLRKAKRLFQNYTKRLTENPEMDQSQRAEAEAQITRIDEQIAEAEAATPAVNEGPEPAPAQPLPADQPARKPVYKRGWFWGLIGGLVVAGAVTAAIVLTRKPGFEPELGSIGPNSSGVALRF